MKKRKIILIITAVIVLGAVFAAGFFISKNYKTISKPDQELTTEQIPHQRAKTGSAILYGKIEKIQLNKTGGDITFRLVEWVQGSDNQEQAALEAGTCSLERIENDECLSNPFFIRDTNKEITLTTLSDADIEVLSPGPSGEIKQDENGNTILRKVGLTDLIKMTTDHKQRFSVIPFIFTTTHSSIMKIQEQYVP